MIRHSIFSEDTQAAVAFSSAAYESNAYFMRNFSRCRELLLVEKDPEGAAEAMMFGIRYARLLHLDDFLLPVVYIDWMLPDLEEELMKQGIPESVVWESLKSGEFMALACPDVMIDQDGYISGTNGRSMIREIRTYLDFNDRTVTGYSADLKRGTVSMDAPVSLNLEEWELKLAPGEKAVAVHIPEGLDLSPDSVDSSLKTAKKYYENYILVCESWMLDAHLEHILLQTGRLISFMQRFNKMPVMTERPQILERVMGFDFTMEALEHFSCTTSLQTSLKKYLLEGNEMFNTAGFMPWK